MGVFLGGGLVLRVFWEWVASFADGGREEGGVVDVGGDVGRFVGVVGGSQSCV